MYTNVQVDIGLGNYASIYASKVLQPKNGKLLTQDMVLEPNTKYIIKHILDLNGKVVRLPENCIIEVDGGQIKNGTLVGNNTILLNPNGVDSIFNNVIQSGTWQYGEGSIVGPQGPPGKSFTYADLTDSEKEDLVSHVIQSQYPDLSTTPSETNYKFEGNTIYQILVPAIDNTRILGNYFDVQDAYFDTSNLPQDITILEAFIFNNAHQESAQCINKNNTWIIYGTNSDFSPDYALIRYYLR